MVKQVKAMQLLLVLWTQQLALATAEPDSLDFRHGISQTPNYELKYRLDFTHLHHINPNLPKGGTLVLPYTYSSSSTGTNLAVRIYLRTFT